MLVLLRHQFENQAEETFAVNKGSETILLDAISDLSNKPQNEIIRDGFQLSSEDLSTIIDNLNKKWEDLIDRERMIFCFPCKDSYHKDLTAVQSEIEVLQKLNVLLEYYRKYNAIDVICIQS